MEPSCVGSGWPAVMGITEMRIAEGEVDFSSFSGVPFLLDEREAEPRCLLPIVRLVVAQAR